MSGLTNTCPDPVATLLQLIYRQCPAMQAHNHSMPASYMPREHSPYLALMMPFSVWYTSVPMRMASEKDDALRQQPWEVNVKSGHSTA
eukprot:scaffold88250_cov21-Tisochrysis_lutea.AAC.4